MAGFNRYAAGRKVYGGGRSNPTSGTVDPTGYIERSANNQASERRSGLAKSAITKRAPSIGARAGSPAPASTAPPPSGIQLGQGPRVNTAPTGQNFAPPPIPQAPAPQYTPQAPAPLTDSWRAANPTYNPVATPQMVDTTTGVVGHANPQIIAQMTENTAQQQAKDAWVRPTDFEEQAETARLNAERERFLIDLNGREDELRGAVGRRIRDLDTQRPGALRELTDNFASRGMGFSGRHSADRTDLDNRFSGMITAENEGLAAQLGQFERARGGKTSEIQALLNSTAGAAAARQAADPRFTAPQVTTARPGFAGMPGVQSQDEAALAAIKRRLLGG